MIKENRKKLTEKQYYKMMGSFDKVDTFEEMYDNWYWCFSYILKSFKVGHTDKSIDHMFHFFDLSNWHLSSREEEKTNEELLKLFVGDAVYISDRTSYDRLFRVHWYFRRIYEYEIMNVMYPGI